MKNRGGIDIDKINTNEQKQPLGENKMVTNYEVNLINQRIEDVKSELKDDIRGTKDDIKEIKDLLKIYSIECKSNMQLYNIELDKLRKFKYEVYAFSSAIAFLSAVGFKIVLAGK